jgi:galactose mutarotase-like enzyme
MHQTLLHLRDEHWDVVVAPADGGGLLKCEFDTLPVLQPVDQPALVEHASSKRQSCYFPLIPYSNRIEDSRFNFQDVPVNLAMNVAGSPHALHAFVRARARRGVALALPGAPDIRY